MTTSRAARGNSQHDCMQALAGHVNLADSHALHDARRSAYCMLGQTLISAASRPQQPELQRCRCLFCRAVTACSRAPPLTLALYASGSRINRAAASPFKGSVGLGYNRSCGRNVSNTLSRSAYSRALLSWHPMQQHTSVQGMPI